MAINIKTKILLPRGTVESFQSKSFVAGELVLIDTGAGKFKVVKIETAGTGLVGDGAATYRELEIDLATSGLSTYAEIKNALSGDGYALSTDVQAGLEAISQDLVDGLATKNKVQIAQSFNGDLEQTDLSVIKVSDADLEGYAAALKNGSLNDKAVYVLDLSAMNALGQKIENVGAPEVDTDAATKAYVDAVASGLGGDLIDSYYTKTDVNSISGYLDGKIDTTKSELEDSIAALETAAALSVANALTAANKYTEDVAAGLTSFVEKSALSIAYDSTAKKIKLFGGATESEIDASDFVKDGMLSGASYDHATRDIILTFNTDAGAEDIRVNVGDLVDTYTVEENADNVQLAVSENKFSAKIVEGSITPAMLSAEAEWIFDCN